MEDYYKTQKDNVNIAFLFIPFRVKDTDHLKNLTADLEKSPLWESGGINVKYFLKFAANKLDAADQEEKRCFHYTLQKEALPKGPDDPAAFYLSEDGQYHNYVMDEKGKSEGKAGYRHYFAIRDVQIYLFNTMVGMFVFEINHKSSDPRRISTSMYYLKKTDRADICSELHPGQSASFVDICKYLIRDIQKKDPRNEEPDYFFYTDQRIIRANALMYVETTGEVMEEWEEPLYLLRNCYYEAGFPYFEDPKRDELEVHRAALDMLWGTTTEASVCMVSSDIKDKYGRDRKDFFHDVFRDNFRKQYLLMYVLLLHQKYTLYMFLTDISTVKLDRDNLSVLEEYRERLTAFETDYSFVLVTEVPQYRVLYDKIKTVFALDTMYDDGQNRWRHCISSKKNARRRRRRNAMSRWREH